MRENDAKEAFVQTELRQGISDDAIIELLRDPAYDGDEKGRRDAIAEALCATSV